MDAHILIPKEMYDAFFNEGKEESETEFNRVLESLPDRSKKMGERLLRFIWNKGMRWNDKGEIVIENERPLIGSNVVDLLRDSVHPLKFVPNKARDFYAYCARLSLPRSLVANTSRREWLNSDEIDIPIDREDVAETSRKKLR